MAATTPVPDRRLRVRSELVATRTDRCRRRRGGRREGPQEGPARCVPGGGRYLVGWSSAQHLAPDSDRSCRATRSARTGGTALPSARISTLFCPAAPSADPRSDLGSEGRGSSPVMCPKPAPQTLAPSPRPKPAQGRNVREAGVIRRRVTECPRGGHPGHAAWALSVIPRPGLARTAIAVG